MKFGLFRRKSAEGAPVSATAPAAANAARAGAAPASAASPARLREIDTLIAKGELGTAREMLEDLLAASPGQVEAQVLLGRCYLLQGDLALAREALSEAVEHSPQHVLAMKTLLVTLLQLRNLDAAAAISQRAVALAPKDAEVLLMSADASMLVGRYEESAHLILRAFEIRPEDPRLMLLMESLSQNWTFRPAEFSSNPRIAPARQRVIRRLQQAHRKGELDSEGLATLLACLAATPGDYPAAVKLAGELADVEPLTRSIGRQIADILRISGDAGQWHRFSERWFECDPDSAEARFSLGSSRIAAGDEHWAAGWREMDEINNEYRAYTRPQGLRAWQGQRLRKNKVLIFQDQGAGDAMLAFRFLPMLRERGIGFEVWVWPQLADMVARVPGVERVIRTPQPPTPAEHGCDCAVSFFGLISALYLRPDEIRNPPVLTVDPGQARPLRERIAAMPGIRLGLLYGGNPLRRDDWARSVPTDLVLRLGSLSGVSWVNLMVDERPDKAQVIESLRMFDAVDGLKNFYDTAAVLDELDAVVSVDASVAHLAASIGKPLWVLAPSLCDWRWQIGAHESPWWPTAHLLRSEAPGTWSKAIERLLAEIAEFVRSAPQLAQA